MRYLHRVFPLWLGLLVAETFAALVLAGDREERDQKRLLIVQAGGLPIILSAPHGGRIAIPDVPERKGLEVAKFTTVRDERTDILAEKLAAALEKRLGARPYLVIAHFDRKYVDANRPAKDAFESEAAKPPYEAYHQALRSACREVQKEWGRGVLFDLHGQGAEEDAIFRGTNNGKTVEHLLDRFGKTALTGPKSVFGVLAKKGHPIIPANDSSAKEEKFTGGYIVQSYGSRGGGTIDAIQLELGTKQRSPKNLDQTVEDVADAIAEFAKEYLPAAKK